MKTISSGGVLTKLVPVLALLAPSVAPADRLTRECNTSSTSEVRLYMPGGRAEDLRAIASDPQASPNLFERMWHPRSAKLVPNLFFPDVDDLVLSFDPLQDPVEIAQAIWGDPRLALHGVWAAGAEFPEVFACLSRLPLTRVEITEYYNAQLDHYFLSSSEEENSVLDSGVAGPDWSRTGERWRTFASDGCHVRPVFRFYSQSANSHFFTADAAECGAVRRSEGWAFEANAFGTSMPQGNACSSGSIAIHRLSNNRWSFNDPNYRFVARPNLRDEMISRGWVYEGVAMCLREAM